MARRDHLIAGPDPEGEQSQMQRRRAARDGAAVGRADISGELAFEGGDLRFPEFGRQIHRPPVGGACVFSCGLLHEATKVTDGRRYAFLPFFYDEAGAAVLAAYEARVAASAEG